MSKTEYNWFKRGKEHRRTADPEGKLPTLVKPTPNTEIRFEYHVDGGVKYEYYYKDGRVHRDGDKPAWVRYYEDGGVKYEYYYKDGRLHRDEDKPARVWYHDDGSIRAKSHYKDGQMYTP